jgi:PadR family transcriptional regulator, regulatory protein PadR
MVHRGRGGSGRLGHRGRLPERGGSRCRWWSEQDQRWRVHGRVERFVEPALLLVLRDVETHGYDLADAVEQLDPGERVDLGNLYRLLRALEAEGIVESTWRDDLPGRAKRTYRLTKEGRRVLDAWAEALRETQQTLKDFLRRYEERTTK